MLSDYTGNVVHDYIYAFGDFIKSFKDDIVDINTQMSSNPGNFVNNLIRYSTPYDALITKTNPTYASSGDEIIDAIADRISNDEIVYNLS